VEVKQQGMEKEKGCVADSGLVGGQGGAGKKKKKTWAKPPEFGGVQGNKKKKKTTKNSLDTEEQGGKTCWGRT